MGLIHELLPRVSAEIGAIGKDQENKYHGYKFRGVDDVLNCCGPVLARHGVCVSLSVSDHKISATVAPGKNGKDGTLYHCTLLMELRFVASDGSSVEVGTAGEAMDTNSDKATNKAMAAAYKYAFFFGLCLPVDPSSVDDSDRYEPSRLEQSAARHFAKQDAAKEHASATPPTAGQPTRTQDELQDAADAKIRAATSAEELEKITRGVRAHIEDAVSRTSLLALAAAKLNEINNTAQEKVIA